MIKLILKLAVVALVANATWRVGNVYVAHYKFTDSVQQTTQFRGNRSDETIKQRVAEIASEFDIPLADDHFSVTSKEHHTIVDGDYIRVIEVAPGFKYPWPFTFHVDTLFGTL